MTLTQVRTGIGSIFAPGSVAVIGASSRRSDGAGNQIIRNLQQAKFAGKIHVINPAGSVIEGLQSVSSIADLPPVDVAVLALPASAVLPTLRELADQGCPAAVVPSVGLSSDDQKAVVELANSTGMFIHGPNCMGIIDVSAGTPLWIDEGILMDLPAGNISLVSQSGSAAIFVARSTSSGGFSKVISTGNEISATTADYISWLATDPDTKIIGVVVESIPDTATFTQAVHKAKEAGKPLVALKVGRTDKGAQATTAHTGAILSSNEAYEAYFEHLDVPLVDDYDELATALECLSGLGDRQVSGTGFGVVTISGGQAALAADLGEHVGIDLPGFSAATTTKLAGHLPGVLIHNPLDAGGSVSATADDYRQALQAVADDPSIDALVVVLDGQASLTAVEIEYEEEYYRAAVEVSRANPEFPVVIASSSSVSIHPSAREWVGGTIPVLRGIRNTFVALHAGAKNRVTPASSRPAGLPDAEKVLRFADEIQSRPEGLSAEFSRELLEAYGIKMVASAVVETIDEAVSWAHVHGYPVVLKVESRDIAHRSDIGGVVLNIRSDEELQAAGRRIKENAARNAPLANLQGFEIQEQIPSDIEAFAGFVSDHRIGQTVGLGMGGTLVEILGDTARSHAPFDTTKSAAMIESTRLGKILSGYRNLVAPTPTEPFADLVSRLSWLASDLGDVVAEADLNPVLIEPATGRVRLVDCLLVGRIKA